MMPYVVLQAKVCKDQRSLVRQTLDSWGPCGVSTFSFEDRYLALSASTVDGFELRTVVQKGKRRIHRHIVVMVNR